MKSGRNALGTLTVALALLALSGEGLAQIPGGPPPRDNFEYIGARMFFEGEGPGDKVVKGVPYSADSVTEATQLLADGNQINHQEKATVYRDSEGRTRRETSLTNVGPWSASGGPHQLIHINDPVAGVNYMLDPREKTAIKLTREPLAGRHMKEVGMKAAQTAEQPPEGPGFQRLTVEASQSDGGGTGAVVAVEKVRVEGAESSAQRTSEPLGTQVMEGLEVQGTRTTETIPAGSIGNVNPITIVNERWYSPELQVYVMTKHSDPRFGETVTQLTNISRQEPALALFQVPPDYTIKEGGPGKAESRRIIITTAPQESSKQ